jgi:uncharacterized protein (TIGR02598 family)
MRCMMLKRLGKGRKSGVNSFTLVEVVIAIAVIALGLISILGAMTYSLQLVRQADTYSRLSNVAGQVLAQYDSQPFSISSNCASTNAVYYFSSEGLPVAVANAYYQVNVTNANLQPWSLSNTMQLQFTIRWPIPQLNNTNVIVSSCLNYD